MPLVGARLIAGADRQRSAPAHVWRSIFTGALLTILLAHARLGDAACPSDRIDERARVSAVIDGDTLALSDGRHLRLIGLNTPELDRNGNPPQAGAVAARDQLRALIFINRQQVALRFDEEREDHYGRLLAHAFLADGRNVTELLLRSGAGSQLVVPPNTWQVDCYQSAMQEARAQRRGIWALADYQSKPAEQLGLRSTGFNIVHGRVSHVRQDTKATWLNLVGNVALRIDRRDLAYFADMNLDKLAGAELEAQGWIQANKGRLSMRLRHPSALKIIAHPQVSSELPSTGNGSVK